MGFQDRTAPASIFNDAKNESAYLKAGLLGFNGSGKTYTAVEIMIGLHKHCESDKPVYFLDTETGSDWAKPRFDEAGIQLLVAKRRDFASVRSAITEAEKNGFGLIVDSVTHLWNEVVSAYKKAKRLGARIPMPHWGPIKDEWRNGFTDLYVNSALHIIVCGRAGWEWSNEANEEGRKELVKTGTKMKVEGEFGFEPSLMIEMQRERQTEDIGAKVNHIGHVIKDRRMDGKSLDGKTFQNPKFSDFLPHIECLSIGGKHFGVDTKTDSAEVFSNTDLSVTAMFRKRRKLIDEISGEIDMRYPGATKTEKTAKAAIKKHFLGTYSSEAIEDIDAAILEDALAEIKKMFASKTYEDDVADIIKALTATT